MKEIKRNKPDRLEGERIYLRRSTEEDADAIVRWRNAPHVVEHFIYRKPITREDHLRWYHERVSGGEVEQFVIGVKESGQEIGSVYFQHIGESSDPRSAEFGIFIGEKEAQGRGYSREILHLFLNYGWEYLALEEIELKVLTDNDTACRAYEQAGFISRASAVEQIPIEGGVLEVRHMYIRRPATLSV